MAKKQKGLSTILAEIFNRMTFPVDYKTATDNANGTFTLGGICDIRHTQPGFEVTIGADVFEVSDYAKVGNSWTIILKAGTNSLPSFPGTFNLYTPFFFHGTPIEQESELTKIPLDKKTPMVYLMEPFETEVDDSVMTSIDRRCRATLCFLTQADVPKWLTEDFYHNAINPMFNLFQDFMVAMKECSLFYAARQKSKAVFYTKFGINIKDSGTKKLLFSENLSGVGAEIYFEIYRDDSCCEEGVFLMEDLGLFIEVD